MFRKAMDDLIDAGELVPITGMDETSIPIFKKAIKKEKKQWIIIELVLKI